MKRTITTLAIVFMLACVGMLFFGLDGSEDDPLFMGSTTYEFDLLYWHKKMDYTFVKIENNQLIKTTINDTLVNVNNDRCIVNRIDIFVDLENDKKPWYYCSCYAVGRLENVARCSVHIKGINDMKTTGFNTRLQ